MTNEPKLSIALPDESFDNFPRKLSADKAASLLKCWTALWHPSLLAFSNARPDIWSIKGNLGGAEAPHNSKHVISVPRFVVADFDKAIGDQTGSCVVYRDSTEIARADVVSQLVERLEIECSAGTGEQARSGSKENPTTKDSLALDFLALGYAWLQVRLMTLHVRYSTNLDNDVFDSELLKAASAWSHNECKSASDHLTRCFDLLLQEKNNYYSVEPELIDLVLVEPSTINSKLDSQLSCDHHINILCSGLSIENIKNEKPDTCRTIKSRLTDGSLTIAGGLQRELPSSLIPQESQLRQFQSGLRTLHSILDTRPRTFARRQFGLTSMTPGLLEQLDYEGACHMTLDGGTLPDVHGSNMRWVGEDAQTVPALATIPLDANDSRSFLDLGIRIAKQIDAEHTSTFVFAHWPDRYCETFRDLIRLTKYGALFGELVGLDDYFQAAYDPGYGEPFTAEQYECPWLVRAIAQGIADPISRFINYWQLYYDLSGCRSLTTMIAMATERQDPNLAESLTEWKTSVERIESSLDSLVDFSDAESNPDQLVTQNKNAIQTLRSEIADRLAEPANGTGEDAAEIDKAVCLLNPTSVSSDAYLREGLAVEVPAMGWVSMHGTSESRSSRASGGPPVDDGLTLRNEHFQISVDQKSGGIQRLQSYDHRQTQASQRLSVRIRRDNQKIAYANMMADDVSVERVSATESRIVSVGHLLDPQTDERLCAFKQTLSLRRKARFANLNIELHDVADLSTDADHYICSRMAWHDESSPVFYGSSEIRSRSTNAWIEAPAYVRIEQPDHSLTLLTNGLPWHRCSARSMLDSVLVVSGERKRQFQLSIGLDCPNDLSAAMTMFLPPSPMESLRGPFRESGWLFHFSSKHIVGVFNEPILNDGRVEGARWRLLETRGRRGKLKLVCPFEVVEAERKMFDGRSAGSLPFEGRVVEIDFTRNEYFEICIYSSPPGGL